MDQVLKNPSEFRYDKALKASEKIGIKKSLLVGVGLAITFLVIFSSYCFAFYMGTNFVHSGRLQGGTVMTVFFAVMMGLVMVLWREIIPPTSLRSMAMGHATQQFGVLGAALGAAGALYEVIDRVCSCAKSYHVSPNLDPRHWFVLGGGKET